MYTRSLGRIASANSKTNAQSREIPPPGFFVHAVSGLIAYLNIVVSGHHRSLVETFFESISALCLACADAQTCGAYNAK